MISVLIRNKNEGAALKNALQSIKHQQTNYAIEIILIDDHSTDNSIDIAQDYNCRVIPLERKFTYGYAINFGLKYCKYDIVLLLSSHNILLSTNFFNKLVQYFEDQTVAGVRCTPVSNGKQVEQSLYSECSIDQSNYVHERDWSNLLIANCSAIRKEVAFKTPFNESIRSNEEKLWCLDVLKKGYTIYSNVPCYFIYNKINKPSAFHRDLISKYQIDGMPPMSISKYLIFLVKSFPWVFKISFSRWLTNTKTATVQVRLPFKYKKGIYN